MTFKWLPSSAIVQVSYSKTCALSNSSRHCYKSIFTIPPRFSFVNPWFSAMGRDPGSYPWLQGYSIFLPYVVLIRLPATFFLHLLPLPYFISCISSAHFCIFYTEFFEYMKDNHQRICPDLQASSLFLRHFFFLMSPYKNHLIPLPLLAQFSIDALILNSSRVTPYSLLYILAICTYFHSFSAQKRHKKAKLPRLLLPTLQTSFRSPKGILATTPNQNALSTRMTTYSAVPSRNPRSKVGTKDYCTEHKTQSTVPGPSVPPPSPTLYLKS